MPECRSDWLLVVMGAVVGAGIGGFGGLLVMDRGNPVQTAVTATATGKELRVFVFDIPVYTRTATKQQTFDDERMYFSVLPAMLVAVAGIVSGVLCGLLIRRQIRRAQRKHANLVR